jgi:putative oxidoreductase
MLSRFEPYIYATFRFVVGFLFVFHGLQKNFGMFNGRQPDFFTLRWLAGIIELVGGTMVALGWYAGPAAFLASGTMAFAYFMVHQPRGTWPIENDGENVVLFCFSFLLIAARGSGALSLSGGKRKR